MHLWVMDGGRIQDEPGSSFLDLVNASLGGVSRTRSRAFGAAVLHRACRYAKKDAAPTCVEVRIRGAEHPRLRLVSLREHIMLHIIEWPS